MNHGIRTTEFSIALQNELQMALRVLRDNSLTVGFAESCTGGLLSSLFTEISGVSDVFWGSVVSYDNQVKKNLLGVLGESLNKYGAVSSVVATQMAEGVLKSIGVKVAISITGIAGPLGGTDEKPVGTVFIAVAGLKSETQVFKHHFGGERRDVQMQACMEAIRHLNKFINN